MRSLFVLLAVANLTLYAFGTGAFGPPPNERGREPQRLLHQIRPEAVLVHLPAR